MQASKKSKDNIVLTGGHGATAAYALVEEILKSASHPTIYWVGTKKAIEGNNSSTLEFKILPKLGVNFVEIMAGRLQRRFTWYTIPSIIKIPIGFFQALGQIIKIHPRIVVSFGGFASFPVVLAAKIFGIPTILHEQTVVAGRSSLASAFFVDQIALAREESLRFFPKKKTLVVGNPINSEILAIKPKSPHKNRKTIFVTGGSRGSVSVNSVLEKILPSILAAYKIIHQTGELDYEKFIKLRAALPSELRNNYQVSDVMDPHDMALAYEASDLIVSRAGANTVSEIVSSKRPAVLIPLAISYKDEQTENARWAQRFVPVVVLKQKDLDSDNLLKAIEKLTSVATSVNDFKYESPDKYASKKLVGLIDQWIR